MTKQVQQFHFARLLAIISIILLHSSASVLFRFEPVFDARWWIGNFIACTTHWAVPFFFMISGALHLGKVTDFNSFYWKKIKRILFPLIIFIGIYAVFNHLFRSDPLSFSFVLKRVLTDQPYEHLYFSFILFELFLITPFINWLIQKKHQFIPPVFFLSLFVTFFFNPGRTILTIWIPFVSFYLAGYLFYASTKKWPVPFLLMLIISSVVLSMLGTGLLTRHIIPNTDGFYFFSYASPFTMLIAFSIFQFLKQQSSQPIFQNTHLKKTATATYGVYLIHPMLILISQLFAETNHITIKNTLLFISFTFLYTTVGSFLIVIFVQELHTKIAHKFIK